MERSDEIEFLREAVRRRVEQTSVRQVAIETKMSHGAIYNLVTSGVVPYGKTLAKLRTWYLELWSRGEEGLTTDAARYLMEQLFGPVPCGARAQATLEILDAIVAVFRRHTLPPPAWVHALGRELRADPPPAAPGAPALGGGCG